MRKSNEFLMLLLYFKVFCTTRNGQLSRGEHEIRWSLLVYGFNSSGPVLCASGHHLWLHLPWNVSIALCLSFRNMYMFVLLIFSTFNFSTSISALLNLPQPFFPFFRLSPLLSIVYILSIWKWLNWFEEPFFDFFRTGHERLLVDNQFNLDVSISNLEDKTSSREIRNRRTKEVEWYWLADEPDVSFWVCFCVYFKHQKSKSNFWNLKNHHLY